jgi:AI-2 transport protein TqsA
MGTESQPDTTGEQMRTVCLAIISLIAVGFALYFLKPVILPFLLALFLCQCLTPLIDLQVHYLRLPPKVAVSATGVLGIAAFLMLAAVAAASVSGLATDLGTYQLQFNQLVARLSSTIPLARLGIERDVASGSFFRMAEGSISGFVSLALTEISDLISKGVLVALFTAFILLGRTSANPRTEGLIAEVEIRVHRYISRTVLLSSLTGALVAIVLTALGVRFAVIFGLFAFLLSFIPVIGPIAATLLPLPIVLLSPDLSPTARIMALLIPGVIQFIIGQIVTPKVMGRSLDLHPVTVLLFLLFFEMIWGIGGAFMATPIAAVVKIVFEHFHATRPFSRLLAGHLEPLAGKQQATASGEAT